MLLELGEIAAGCPPWLSGLAGFGLGAMTKQSLRRLLTLLGRSARAPPRSEG